MSSKDIKQFREILQYRINAAREPLGRFRAKYGLDELLNEILTPSDSPKDIAAKSLVHLCTDGGQFNGSRIGLMAIVLYLNAASRDRPQLDRDIIECNEDLKGRLAGGFGVAEAIAWIEKWYVF